MNAAAHMSTLYPLLPEIVLGLGAMALLMLGAYGDARTARLIDGLAIALLIAAGVILYLLPAGKLVSFNGSFVVDNFARFLKILALAGSAAGCGCRGARISGKNLSCICGKASARMDSGVQPSALFRFTSGRGWL